MSSSLIDFVSARIPIVCANLVQHSNSQLQCSAAELEAQFRTRLPHLFADIDISSRSTVPLCRTVDHTLLKAEASTAEIHSLCREAVKFNFFAVCVNPSNAETANKFIIEESKNSKFPINPVVAVVVGFPLGASTAATKSFEAAEAAKFGAREIDLVLNIGAVKENNYFVVYNEIKSVVDAVKPNGAIVKVILESALLNESELIADASLVAALAGAEFIKTSTGFSAAGGAKLDHVKLMKAVAGNSLQVKASGGIRDKKAAEEMIAAGASRLGTSAGVAIASGSVAEEGKY